MNSKWFVGLELAVILIVGLVLVPFASATRWLAVGAAIVLLVAIAIFLPTFARQTANWVTASAGFLVMVVWLVWYMAVTRPRHQRDARLVMATSVPSAAAPTAPPAASDTPQKPEGSQAGEGGKSHE